MKEDLVQQHQGEGEGEIEDVGDGGAQPEAKRQKVVHADCLGIEHDTIIEWLRKKDLLVGAIGPTTCTALNKEGIVVCNNKKTYFAKRNFVLRQHNLIGVCVQVNATAKKPCPEALHAALTNGTPSILSQSQHVLS